MRIIPLNRIVKNIDEGPRSGHMACSLHQLNASMLKITW
jgi:hypothetical protein